MYPKANKEKYDTESVNHNERSHHALLRIERLLKDLISSLQNQEQDKDEIKANLVFEYNKLAEFKEERDKLRQTVSFKCYWDAIERVWIFEGNKDTLEDFVHVLKNRGTPRS